MGARPSDQILADRLGELLQSSQELVHGIDGGCDCIDPVDCFRARRDHLCDAATALMVELAAWEADERERAAKVARLESPTL